MNSIHIFTGLNEAGPSNVTISLRAGEVSLPIYDHTGVPFLKQDAQSLKDVP